MGLVGSYTVAGSPGAGADRVINYTPPPSLNQKPTDAREAKRLADDEKARMKFVSDAGKAVKFSQGSEILDEDQETILTATDEYIDMAADMADPANKDKYKSVDSQRELAKKRQEIAMLTAKAQQHYKTVKFGDQKVALHRNLWDFEKYKAARDKYTSTPLKERGDDPGFRMREQTDFLTPFSKKGKMPAVATWTKDIPGPDGTTSVKSYSGMDPEKAKELASTLLSNPDDPQVKGLLEYALVNGLEQVNPNWAQNMTPKEQGLIVRKTAEQMLVDYWGTLIPTKEGDKIKKTPGDQNAQYGLADAEKAGVVVRDMPIKVNYSATASSTKGDKSATKTSTKVTEMKAPYSMSIPQSAKTKATVPASSEVVNIETGKPLENPDEFNFVPGHIVTWTYKGEIGSWVLGTSVNKVKVERQIGNTTTGYKPEMVDKTQAMDVMMPLDVVLSNMKNAGVHTDWTKDAEKELAARAKRDNLNKLNGVPNKAPAKPGTSKKKPIGNLNF